MPINNPGVAAWITNMDETATSLAMHYRRRAEEIRFAATSQSGPTRETLLHLAEGYESAARFHEQTLRFRTLVVGNDTAR